MLAGIRSDVFMTTILKCATGLLGAACVVLAVFLYEDEEKQIQSRIAEWWVRVDARRSALLYAHGRFVLRTFELSTAVLDRLFGSRLWSRRAIGVSGCLSLVALYSSIWLVAGGRTSRSFTASRYSPAFTFTPGCVSGARSWGFQFSPL